MNAPNPQRERGAILVQVALMMVVLLLFAGLAVDVGALYSERRQMQNAADAGALAGARAICSSGDPVNAAARAAAAAAADDYAVDRNNAATAVVEIIDNYTVHVTATRPTAMRFAVLIGLASVDVSAEATAACGQATKGCGSIWPIAVSEREWNLHCGEVFYVWDDDKLDCSTGICDIDNDGIDEVKVGGARGWLDLSGAVEGGCPAGGNGCGASELKNWISCTNPATMTLPVCVGGDNGVKNSAAKLTDDYIGRQVYIPLYDSLACTAPVSDCGLAYHVVRLGCATNLGYIKDYRVGSKKGKVIMMRLECENCTTNCGGAGGAPGPQDLRVVSLIN